MPFSVDLFAAARNQYVFTVRRTSDGSYWSCDGRWVADTARDNVLPEKAPGCYGALVTDTSKNEIYYVTIRRKHGGAVIANYACDSAGYKLAPGKSRPRKVELVGDILHIDDVAEAVDVIYQERDPDDQGRIHTAIRWRPSRIATCNCREWREAKGHAESRRCRHVARLATIDRSILVSNPPPPVPVVGHTGRAGRGIELD
jgi:hypothetical protein